MGKKIKKKGQAFIEFCICVPIIIMLVIGLFDVCSMNAMRIELQGFCQKAVNAYVINKNWTVGGITQEAGRMAAKETVFCLQSKNGGGEVTPRCENPRPVNFKLLIPKKFKNGQWAAGNIACIKGEIQYSPIYKKLLPKSSTTLSATACSSIEYSGPVKLDGRSGSNLGTI